MAQSSGRFDTLAFSSVIIVPVKWRMSDYSPAYHTMSHENVTGKVARTICILEYLPYQNQVPKRYKCQCSPLKVFTRVSTRLVMSIFITWPVVCFNRSQGFSICQSPLSMQLKNWWKKSSDKLLYIYHESNNGSCKKPPCFLNCFVYASSCSFFFKFYNETRPVIFYLFTYTYFISQHQAVVVGSMLFGPYLYIDTSWCLNCWQISN